MILKNYQKRIITSLLLLSLIILIFLNNFLLCFSLIVLGVYSFLEFSNLTKKIFKIKPTYIFINIFFIIFIFTFCVLFFLISNSLNLRIILFIFLLGCISSDIGGYIFGKIIKGPKLTKISPNKTISGSIGSLFLCTLTIMFLFYYLTGIYNLKIFMISFLTSIFCQIGDLFFSFLKRKAKMKDTGNFLPGHGGILDRIDGIIIGLPFGFFTFIFFI